MRITNSMQIDTFLNNLNVNLTRLDKVQNQLATGKKISLPSDDPMIASRALKYRSDISEINQYIKNIQDASSWEEVTDSTLNTIGEVIQRTRELAVQASSDTNSSSDRIQIKQEIDQLYQQMVKLANTSYAGRYIFSGYKTDKPLILEANGTSTYTDIPVVTNPPTNDTFRLRHNDINVMTNIKGSIGGAPVGAFTIVAGVPAASGEVQVDMTTGQLTFFGADVTLGLTNVTASYSLNRVAGDYNPDVYSFSSITQTVPMENEFMKYEVGIGDKIEVNVLGTDLFGAVSGTGNTGSNILNMLNFINALNTNDTDGIKQAIADCDTFLNSILEQRADVGARANRLELSQNRLNNELTNFTDLMSKNEDVDMAEVIMNLKNEENVYKASLDAGARIIQPSLMDYLR